MERIIGMMNRKFITSICVCLCALMAVVGSTYYVKKDNGDNEVKLESAKSETEEKLQEAQNEVEKIQEDIVEDMQETADRVSEGEEQASSYTGNVVDVGSNTIEETDEYGMAISENETIEEETTIKVVTENSEKGDGSLNGLSTEANAMINSLDFGVDSEMLWPVEGNILLEYNMDNTIYFSTLNEYKTNPALVIQGTEYAPVIAATKGVVTEIDENDEIGVYLKMSVGNDYEVTYGQIINPTVEVGETVEAGTAIACVNEPTRYYEKEGYNLYFSVTKNGEPVDPMEFLVLSE